MENISYSLLENIPHIIMVVDREGTIEFINSVRPGFEREKVIGSKVYDYIDPRYHSLKREMITKAFDEGATSAGEIVGAGPGGADVWYEAYVAPVVKESRIVAVTIVSTDITKRKKSEEDLKESKSALKKQAAALEKKNVALEELLKQVEAEKQKIRENVGHNVDEVLLPMLKKIDLKNGSSEYGRLLQQHLESLSSSFGREITRKSRKLTPKEIELCCLVKGGLSNKDIARLLNLSPQTIERHRKNIRKKLGISTQKVNLTSYLQQF